MRHCRPAWPRSWATAFVLLAFAAEAAPATVTTLQKKARARMKSLDFEAALPLLEQAQALPDTEPAKRTALLVDLAVTYVNLGRPDDARKAFDAALALTPALELPDSAPPKVKGAFDDAREQRHARLTPPPVAPVVDAPPPSSAPVATPLAVTRAPTVKRERMLTLPLVLAGLGAGAAVFGLVASTQTQQTARALTGALRPTGEVDALLAQRQTWNTLTWVGYGGAAAFLAAGAAFFLFSGGEGPAPSVMIVPGAAAFALSGSF